MRMANCFPVPVAAFMVMAVGLMDTDSPDEGTVVSWMVPAKPLTWPIVTLMLDDIPGIIGPTDVGFAVIEKSTTIRVMLAV